MALNDFVMQTLGLLGLRGQDKITGYKGVITSVNFDLYGCVVVAINPGIDKDGSLIESLYFDVQRITILDDEPVMPAPDYAHYAHTPAQNATGAAEKPPAKH